MNGSNSWRSRGLKFVATALLGLTLIALVSQPAESAPWRRGGVRGWGGGYRAYRMPYRNYARAYPRVGYGAGYGYGYRGVARATTARTISMAAVLHPTDTVTEATRHRSHRASASITTRPRCSERRSPPAPGFGWWATRPGRSPFQVSVRKCCLQFLDAGVGDLGAANSSVLNPLNPFRWVKPASETSVRFRLRVDKPVNLRHVVETGIGDPGPVQAQFSQAAQTFEAGRPASVTLVSSRERVCNRLIPAR